ncbi:MAG TPA: HD domain-containing phosphohydrolase [Pyrinomonadaceae bacterium]
MAQERAERKGLAYEVTVIAAGLALWLGSVAGLWMSYSLRDNLIFLALVPLIVVAGMFPNVFPMPSGLRLTKERITFTLSDGIILLVACWYGLAPAVFISGLDGLISSRRAVRRLSSNVFSFGMLSLVAGASSVCLSAVLRHGFGESGTGPQQSFPAVAVSLLAASVVHIVVNTGLFAAFFALRRGESVRGRWRESFLWAAPIFLPTSAIASLLYIALQFDALLTAVIGAPLLLALYFGQRQYRDSMQERIDLVERASRERMSVMEKAHRQTIEALAVAINAKDEVTHGHVLRVQIYAAGVARLLGCDDSEVEALRAGALLHDIGKIAVPDYILNKPGKLTADEFDKMKLHTVAGAQILSRVEFPYPVVPVVRHHHERFDGKGYPDGLKGEDIPLTARILSVVDCFDAVREDRQYRKAMTRDEAIDFIMQGSGTQYDPRVVGTFITHLPEFEAEIQAHRDDPAENYGIAPMEQLSAAALLVPPAAGLAEADAAVRTTGVELGRENSEALDDMALALKGAPTEGEIISTFVEALAALVPYDTCALTLAASDAGENRVVRAAGRNASLLAGRAVAPGEGVTGWVLANRKAFFNADPRLDLPAESAADFADYRTLGVAPLTHGEKFFGAVSLYSAALATYTAEQQRLLQAAASLAAAALADIGDDGARLPCPLGAPRNDPAATPLESTLTH